MPPTLFPLMFSLALLPVLTACGTVSQPRLIVPDSFRQPCAGPATEGVKTVGDLAVWGVREEAALQVCDTKRAALVGLIDATAPKRKGWFRGR